MIWREGMGDWANISGVDLFSSLAISDSASPVENIEFSENLDWLEDSDIEQTHTAGTHQEVKSSKFPKPPAILARALEVVGLSSQHVRAGDFRRQPANDSIFRAFQGKTLLAVLAGSTFVVIAVLFLARHSGSAFVPLNDVSREENRELSGAISESLTLQGPSFAIARSQLDPLTPTFYIATNLSNGSKLDFLIEGIPETLLGSFKVSVHAEVIVKNGLARTPVFRQEQGNPYPTGQYRVSIPRDGKSPIAQKTYFVGSKEQDYDVRLKAYHEHLQKQSATELIEIKQLVGTLENQLEETEKVFQKIIPILHRNKSIPWPGVTWTEFHPHWKSFQMQLARSLKSAEPHYHSELYELLEQAEKLVSKAHAQQNEYLTNAQESASLESKIDNEAAVASSSLKTIRMKILSAENGPALASGMPQP